MFYDILYSIYHEGKMLSVTIKIRKFKIILYKTISLALIPIFLSSTLVSADIIQPHKNTLAPYSIFKLVLEENEEELKKLTPEETPTGEGMQGKRVDEFGKPWVAECTRRLAAKMAAKINAERGEIDLDIAENELIHTVVGWADQHSVPKHRKGRLRDAIRVEFAKYKFYERTKENYRKAYETHMPPAAETSPNTYQLPFLNAPERFDFITVERPKQAPAGGLVVEIESCYICNTDVQYYLETRGKLDPNARGILGHEAVGRVRIVGKGVDGYSVGDRVRLGVIISDPEKSATKKGVPHMDAEKVVHGHEVPGFFAKDAIILKEDLEAGLVRKIPNTVSSKYAALSEPISCALYNLMLTKVDIDGKGEKLVIWGAGFQGVIHAILASLIDEVRYNKIILFDKEVEKIKRAREILDSLGLYHVELYNTQDQDITEERITELYADTDATIFAYSPTTQEATEKAYQRACALSRKGAVVSAFGGIRENWPAVSGRKVHSNQISIIGNSGASAEVLERSYKLIEGVLPEELLDRLISAEFPLERLQDAFKLAASGKAMKIRVICNEDRPAQTPEDLLKEFIRRANKEGLKNAKISIRENGQIFYIDTELASRDSVLQITNVMRDVSGIGSPDLAIHVKVFQENPDIKCIVQSRPPTIQKVTEEGKTLPPLSPDFVAVLKPREDINYRLSLLDASYDALPQQIAGELSIKEGTTVLTTKAGVISCGRNLLEAYYRNKLVEEAAKTFQAAEHMGKVNHLTNEDANKLAQAYFERYRQILLSGDASSMPKLETVEVEYDKREIDMLREGLTETGRKIAKAGLVVGPGGNISAVTKDRRIMLIKASGFSFENMSPEAYIGVDMETGKLVKGLEGPNPELPLKPSSEVNFHRAIYLKRTDIFAVVHTHPPVATGIACAEKSIQLDEVLKNEIPRIPYIHPGGKKIDEGLPKAVANGLSGSNNYLLMTNHGSITIADCLETALSRSLQVEEQAKGKIANERIFQERYKAYLAVQQQLEALGETKGKGIAEIKKILDLRNKVMFRLEELLIESEKKPISRIQDLKANDIIFNIMTKEVFEYTPEDSRFSAKSLSNFVVLKPLSILAEHRKQRNQLITMLYDQSENAGEIHEAALLRLKAMEKQGILPRPFEMPDIFQHCHTDYSHSLDLLPDGSVGYRTPSAFAWRAYQLGLLLSGQCDHDINNFDEFLKASKILELRNPTCAYEQRVMPYGTDFMRMDINSPGNNGEIYMVVHAVSENGNEQLDMPDGVRQAKIARFKRNLAYLNRLELSHKLDLDYDTHIRPLTRVNNPTEKHLAEAIARRIYEIFAGDVASANWNPIIRFTEKLINESTKPKESFIFDEKSRTAVTNISDFTFLVRDKLVTPLKKKFPPSKKECIDIEEFVEYAHSKGYLVYYPYLGDPKGCEAEKRENVRKLFRYMKKIGVDGIAFMHNRNSREELDEVLQIAREEGLERFCNGMDVNKEGMPFLYFDISCKPEYVKEALIIYKEERKRRRPNEYRNTFGDEVCKKYHDYYANLIVASGEGTPDVKTNKIPVLTDYLDPDRIKGQIKYIIMREPEAPDGGVVVAIESCAICGTDLNIWRGRRSRDQKMLDRDIFIQGHEAVGRIVKIGRGVNKKYRVGQRVVLQTIISDGSCPTCQKGLCSMCDERRAKSHQLPGYFAPQITFFEEDIKAGNLIPVSDEPNSDHLALVEPIACALYSLSRSKNPEIERLRGKQEKLVIWGTGFQGMIHAILAALVDEVKYKEIILFGRNEMKNEKARRIFESLGLYNIKVYNNEKIKPEEIDRICGNDTDTTVIAFSPQDGESAKKLYFDAAKRTRPGGAVNLFGGLDKDWPVISPRQAHYRHIRFIGNSGAATDVLEKVARLIENKTIPPRALDQLITHRYPLSETQEAFEAAGSKDALKVVIHCDECGKPGEKGSQWQETTFSCGGKEVRATYNISKGYDKTLILEVQFSIDGKDLGALKIDMKKGGVIIGKDYIHNKDILNAIAKEDIGQELFLRIFMFASEMAKSQNLNPQCIIIYGIFDVHLPQPIEVLAKETRETLPIVESMESIGVRSTAVHLDRDKAEELFEETPQMVIEYASAWSDQISSQYMTLSSLKQELERRTTKAMPDTAIGEVSESTKAVETQRFLDIGDTADLSNIAILVKKNLTEGATKNAASSVLLAQEYRKMIQSLRKMLPEGEKRVLEFESNEDLVSKVNKLRENPDVKVVILDDGNLKVKPEVIKGERGKDYCVIATDASRYSTNETLIQFINLNAMTFMGVGVLNSNERLFKSAYKTFTGVDAPEELVRQAMKHVSWFIKALPRMVRLTGSLTDRDIIRRLFEAAA